MHVRPNSFNHQTILAGLFRPDEHVSFSAGSNDKKTSTMNYQECIDACLKCMTDCEYCLEKMIGKNSHNDCPHCCRECLDICDLCAKALARGSKYSAQYCELCAEICEWCAEQCAAHDHEHCQKCAESCRKCAEECREVAMKIAA